MLKRTICKIVRDQENNRVFIEIAKDTTHRIVMFALIVKFTCD